MPCFVALRSSGCFRPKSIGLNLFCDYLAWDHFRAKYVDTKNNLHNILYNNVQSMICFKVSFKRDIHKKQIYAN